MRGALAAAVHALLSDPRLAKSLDVVRLAAVVVLAKAPATSSRVRVLYRDLAGWLGCSPSHVGHTVVPALKKAGVVTGEPDRDERGRTTAVVLDLAPLREARSAGGTNPLALLTQKDLATLLRVCEAVTCPGWAPTGQQETPAGFMAKRRGHDAATDRLAMVLLVLAARNDGRVRMTPGRVAGGFGRGDATVARLLGCEVEKAVPVVDRLLGLDVLHVEAGGRDRLRVSAVAEAYVRLREAAKVSAPEEAPTDTDEAAEAPRCPRCCASETDGNEDQELVIAGDGWAQESLDDVLAGLEESAFRDQQPPFGASSQVNDGFAEGSPDGRSAGPHADHAPVADVDGVSAADLGGFSGSAVRGCDDQREGARGREDHAGQPENEDAVPGSAEGPLRGEKPKSTPSSRGSAVGAVVAVPEDLQEVLEPLRGLWSKLGRTSTSKWLVRPVRLELVRLRGLLGEEHAVKALADRLRRRLYRQGTRPVDDLAGWLLRRGLPQKAECWSHLCDDGFRIDTGGPCESCSCVIGDRRGLRQAAAAAVAARHPRLSTQERRPLYEQELRRLFEGQAACDAVRRERAAREREQRERAVAEQRAQRAQQEAEHAARPCRSCGLPDAGGHCLRCSLADTTRQLVEQAVEVVLAPRADLDDAQAVVELAERVEHDTWNVVRQVDTEDPGERAYGEYDRARRLLEQHRARALVALAASETAETEARHVQRTALRHIWPVTAEAHREAEEAAEEARERVAQDLLTRRLGELRRLRAVERRVPDTRPWSERLAERLDPQQAGAARALVGAR